MKPNLLIFDCDGVLVDSEIIANRAGIELLADLGIDLSLQESIELFTGVSDRALQKRLEEKFQIRLSDIFLSEFENKLNEGYTKFLEPIKDIFSVLKYLESKKIMRSIASNSNKIRLQKALSITQLKQYFNNENIYSADVVEHPKPAPDLFLYVSDQMKINPTDCLVIEDSPPGIQAAKEAGMPVFAFLGATHAQSPSWQKQIKTSSPNKIISNTEALLAEMKKLFEK